MKAAALQAKAAAAEAQSVQKVLSALKEIGETAAGFMSPSVQTMYQTKTAAAADLVKKIMTAPPGQWSNDCKQMKSDLSKLALMLKSQMKSAQRFM